MGGVGIRVRVRVRVYWKEDRRGWGVELDRKMKAHGRFKEVYKGVAMSLGNSRMRGFERRRARF